LISFAGDVSQTGAGIIVAGSLDAESFAGAVNLPLANRIGANDVGGIAQIAGKVSGSSDGNFTLRNDNAGLAVDVVGCGCGGIFTTTGDVALLTTNAGGITVNQQISAGGAVAIGVAAGSGFANNSEIGANGTVVILADTMSLAAGAIATGGTVLLGPTTVGNSIALGAAGGAGTLGLQQVDLDTIAAGALQIGYRTPAGGVSLTGAIDVAGNIQINTANIPSLLLVTGGAVTESGGAITATGGPALELGVLAGGPVTMSQSNTVGTLADYTDAASQGITFVNSGQDLTIGALTPSQLGVAADSNGFPTATVMTGTPSNPLSGLTTNGGAVSVQVVGGALALAANVTAAGQTVTLNSAGGITQPGGVITAGTLTGTAGGDVTLNQLNAVSALGSFAVTGGNFTLTDGGVAGTLTASGPVSATNITITGAPALNVTGTVSASA